MRDALDTLGLVAFLLAWVAASAALTFGALQTATGRLVCLIIGPPAFLVAVIWMIWFNDD